MFSRAESMFEKNAAPSEIFRAVNAQITADLKAGRIGKDTAADARERTRDNLANRRDQLQQEGARLAKSLQSPAQNLRDEIQNITRLEKTGSITGGLADRAKQRAKGEFLEEEKRRRGMFERAQGGMRGMSGTASAQGALMAALSQSGPAGNREDRRHTELLDKLENVADRIIDEGGNGGFE